MACSCSAIISVSVSIFKSPFFAVATIISPSLTFNPCRAVAYWLNMRTHNTGVVSSIPPCVTFKTILVRKATGDHLIKSTSLEKTHSLWFLLCSKASMLWNPMKILLARKATGSHLMRPTSLEKTQAPSTRCRIFSKTQLFSSIFK